MTVEADLEASLSVALPPLVELTHRPERIERRTETVSVVLPGIDETVSETVSVPAEDGTVTDYTISAHCSIPGNVVHEDVTMRFVHPEHVSAEVVERAPLARSREESVALASSVWSDDAYVALAVPEPEPEPDPVTQTPVTGGELSEWFEQLGWEWPW